MLRRVHSVLVCLTLLSAPLFSAAGHGGQAAPARVPVVVELFTSEGCSSCPPADKLLADLDRMQPVPGALIIPLEEHVDYWNSDGWQDPFSSAEFTSRQQLYARHLRLPTPYTPQMIVAGRTDVRGSASRDALAAIAEAAQAPSVEVGLEVTSDASPNSVLHAAVRADSYPADAGESAEACLAITEDDLSSNVSAGENKGRHVEHRAVVRKFIYVDHLKPGKPFTANVSTRIAREWKRENLRVVVFLAGDSTGKIFGAATATVGR